METLSDLPNVGKVLETYLIEIGVESPEQLRELGSREVFMRIRLQKDSGACLNMLYGIQGAIEGVRWKYLSDQSKKDLKNFYHSI